jgi:hypothetical protein
MHNINNIRSRCNKKKYLCLAHSCKVGMKNTRNGIIYQHMNATYQTQSLEMTFAFVPLVFFIVFAPQEEYSYQKIL